MPRTLAACMVGFGVAVVGGHLHLHAAWPQGPRPGSAPAQIVTSRLQPTSLADSSARAVLDRYCVTCHNARLRTAGLMLDTMDVERVGDHAEAWEKVVRKLRTRTMPPVARPRPDQATYTATKSINAVMTTTNDTY